MRCSALRAFFKVGVQTSIANTRIDAACKFHGVKAGERPNMGLRVGEILHARLGKVIRHFMKS